MNPLPTDRLGFYLVLSDKDYQTALQLGATMVHIHLTCGHHWVLDMHEAKQRITNNQCPVCAAATQTN